MGLKKTAPEHENVMEWEGYKKSSGRGDDYENSVGVCVCLAYVRGGRRL